ncbi:MAG: glucosamine-fructose-6-phosphate aminotransferase, partial [Candidatus Uhrbacteria bacterium GW2011_GWF2_44_350]
MCGIIGYIGHRTDCVQSVILPGLAAMEERGYDSAGVACLRAGQMLRARAIGKLGELRLCPEIQEMDEVGAAIGHTRWATHGGVTVKNTHPHADCTGGLVVIHNGIIENHDELRRELKEHGHHLSSQTDTELIAHLIEEAFQAHETLEEAVRLAVSHLKGTWGLVILSARFPNELVVARHGSPILIGIGNGEMFVASLEDAFTRHTKRFNVLPENSVRTVRANGFTGSELPVITAEEMNQVSSAPFAHFMLKEIMEQPDTALRTTNFGARLIIEDGTAKLGGLEGRRDELLGCRHLRLVACGTASFAAGLGAHWLEEFGGFETVQMIAACDARPRLFPPGTAFLAISQSGETYDVLEALKAAKRGGHSVFSIVNRVGKAIARETGCGIYTNAGVEKAVASTKVFLAQSVALLLLTAWFGRQREKMNRSQGRALGRALNELPDQIRCVLEMNNSELLALATRFFISPNCYFLGRGPAYWIAAEGALKIKEVAYIHAEAYNAGEMKHGPIALIENGFPVIGIVLDDEYTSATMNNLQEAKARGAYIVVVAPNRLKLPTDLADLVLRFPNSHHLTSPLLATVPLQLLAYYSALALGHDPDR